MKLKHKRVVFIKVFAFSDIHIDMNKSEFFDFEGKSFSFVQYFLHYINSIPDLDVIICAGDVSPNVNELSDFLNLISNNVDCKNLLFVPGNHDIWEFDKKESEKDCKTKYNLKIPEGLKNSGFNYLPNNPRIIDDVAFIGNIGWYDYSFKNPKWEDVLKKRKIDYSFKVLPETGMWMDAEYANWGMSDKAVVEYLLERFSKDYKKVESIPTKCAVFHHIPFQQGVFYKDDITWDFFSAFMGSDKFGQKILEYGIKYVFYGHTHFPHKYKVTNCHVFCPAIGYRNEWKTENLKSVFTSRTMIVDILRD
jgi:putative phosphoesterase